MNNNYKKNRLLFFKILLLLILFEMLIGNFKIRYKDKIIFEHKALIKEFRIEDVQKNARIFNYD